MLDELMALVEVVEAGGFSAASERCGVTVSRLSRSIAALEKKLDVSLLIRSSRRVQTTELGQEIFNRGLIIRAEAQRAVAIAENAADGPSGYLHVVCPLAIATEFIGPLALEFLSRYPEVCLNLDFTDGRPPPPGKIADLVIQPAIKPLSDSSLIARNLAQIPYVMVAAPSLLDALGRPSSIEQLKNAPAIGWAFLPNPSGWPLVHAQQGTFELEVQPRLISNNLFQTFSAARAGIGLALLPVMMCAADIQSGKLCVAIPGWAPPPVSVYAIYPSRRALTTAGRGFLELIESRLKQMKLAQ